METEFNGSQDRADILTNGIASSGNLFDFTDKDYFVTENVPVGTLEVVFDSPTSAITYATFVLQVLDGSGNIVYGEESGGDINFDLAVKQAGDYYFLVSPNYHNEDWYSLTITHSEDASSHHLLTEAENNNSIDKANIITSIDSKKGQLYSADDVDFFGFTAGRTGTVTVTFDAPPGGALTYDSFTVELLDYEQNVLNRETTSHSLSFNTLIGETGDYFVKVSSSYPYEDGIYSLAVDAPFNASPTISIQSQFYYALHGENSYGSLDQIEYTDPEHDNWTHTSIKLVSQNSSDKLVYAVYLDQMLLNDTWQTFENATFPEISYTRPNKFSVNEVQVAAFDGESWSNVASTYLVSVADIIAGDATDEEITTTIGSKDSYVIDGGDGYDQLSITITNNELNQQIKYGFTASEDDHDQEIFLLNFENISYNLPDKAWNWNATQNLTERVYFGSDDDTVIARADGDFYFGGSGHNLYVPSNEIDSVEYDANYGTVTSSNGVDYIKNFLTFGTDGDDHFYGRIKETPSLLDWFTVFLDQGEFPYDKVDMFAPGGGNNNLQGAAGIDMAWYYGNGTSVSIDLAEGTASHSSGNTDTLLDIEMVAATDHNDVLIGDDKDNFFVPYNGNDDINGGAGSDSVSFSGSGIHVSLLEGNAQALDAESSPNFGNKKLTSIENVIGTEEADELFGDNVQNYIAGDGGNDKISGGAGDDYIFGGTGNDTLTGGAGKDHFVYYFKTNAPIGADTITDFDALEDSIDLIGYDNDQVIRTLNSSGHDLLILSEDDTGNQVTVNSVVTSEVLNIPIAKSQTLMLSAAEEKTTLDVNSFGNSTASQVSFNSVSIAGITNFSTQISSETFDTDPITINDVITQLKNIVGLKALRGKFQAAADIDNDGEVQIADVILSLRHIVGLDPIETFDLVTDNGFVINALNADSVGSLSLVINGDADQSHADWVALTDTNITGTLADDIIDLNSSDYALARQTILVDGGAGNDTIIGSDSDENILGGTGNDILFGGSGTNTLTGGAGADEFQFDKSSLQTTISDFNLSEGDTIKIINQRDGSFSFDQNSIRSNAAKDGLLIDYNENGSPGTFDLSLGLKDVSLHTNGALLADTGNGSWFDRSLSVNGLELVIAGDAGGQSAVPDDWVYKVAQTVKLLIDPYADGIDLDAQNQMIKVLSGDVGTWHAGSPTGQRLANGEGNYYSPNPLENPESYQGYEAWMDETLQNDIVWYHDPNSGNISVDEQINEVLEHLMHTIHLFGVRGAVDGSYEALMGSDIEVESSNAYKNQELYLAMKEAMENGVFNPDYRNAPDHIFLKEYTFLLNYNMWELGKVFWEDDNGDGLGSLAPEWSDAARTREGILENNPLGHALFERYFDPVLSAPDVETLSALFQQSTEGASNYSVDPKALPGSDEFLLSVQIEIM